MTIHTSPAALRALADHVEAGEGGALGGVTFAPVALADTGTITITDVDRSDEDDQSLRITAELTLGDATYTVTYTCEAQWDTCGGRGPYEDSIDVRLSSGDGDAEAVKDVYGDDLQTLLVDLDGTEPAYSDATRALLAAAEQARAAEERTWRAATFGVALPVTFGSDSDWYIRETLGL